MSNKKEYEIVEIGYMKPGGYIEAENLVAGEVGYVAASIKQVSDIRVGDTLTLKESPASEPLNGYKKQNQWFTQEYFLLKELIMKN